MMIVLLLVAGFLGGSVNAVAGGGTFFTFPALLLAGVPPVAANATGTVALLPGYVTGVLGFREDFQGQEGISLPLIVIASLVGGAMGATLLVLTSDQAFRAIIPWLTLLATAWFASWPFIKNRFIGTWTAGQFTTVAGVVLVCVYGGYFNGGMGIILLALFGALGLTNLNFMNGLKNLVSVLLTTIAVLIYAVGGVVLWKYAVMMALSSALGGYAGARVARQVPEPILRGFIILIGLTITIVFFVIG